MDSRKPRPTLADYLGIGISPVLIMALVGSLIFFLFELFYQGAYAGRLRWTLFWFVLASVLVSRISIERGSEYATLYGMALAFATGFLIIQLAGVIPVAFVLLGLIWWATSKLTWDCTLTEKEDEDEEASHVIQPKRRRRPHAPGKWLIYFCLVTLPAFGVGQIFLSESDPSYGFRLFGLHLVAGFGLLLTTSFLGLRRYLRRSYLQMPAAMTRSWLVMGVGMAVLILLTCLVLPRPDSAYTLDRLMNSSSPKASDPASGAGDAGQGPGNPEGNRTDRVRESQRESDQGEGQRQSTTNDRARRSGESEPGNRNEAEADKVHSEQGARQEESGDQTGEQSEGGDNSMPWEAPAQWVRWVIYGVLTLFALYWAITRGAELWKILVSLLRELAGFWRNLFKKSEAASSGLAVEPEPGGRQRAFVEYDNPFDQGWAERVEPGELVRYSYEAMEVWAAEQGRGRSQEQTPLEFGRHLAEFKPELTGELRRMISDYVRLAYAGQVPSGSSRKDLERIWREMTAEIEKETLLHRR